MKMKNNFLLKIICLVTLLGPQFAWALESTAVLPKKIFRLRMIGASTSDIDEKLNSDGSTESLAKPLNRSVTVTDLAQKQSATGNYQLGNLMQTLNTLQPGLGSQLGNTNLYSDTTMQVKQLTLVLQYGATDDVSVGIVLPVIKRTASVNFYADSTINAQTIANLLGTLSPTITGGLAQYAATGFDTRFFEQQIFTAKGYEAPRSFSKTEIGDLEVGQKFRYYNSKYFSSAILTGLRAPTGSQPSLTNIYDRGTSNGCWAGAVQTLHNYTPYKFLNFGAAAKYTYNFENTRRMAVPLNEQDTLPSVLDSSGQVQEVTRKRGNQVDAEVSSSIIFSDEWNVWSAYQYTHRQSDKYSGPGNLYYAGLEKDTEVESYMGEFGIYYSTIPAFRKKRFAVPMDISAQYNRVLSGRNTEYLDYVRTDLMIYF